jgi:hypothetical protein
VGGFRKTNAGKAVEKAVDEGVEFLISKLPEIPWTGKVILAKGDKIYINRGTREGVNVGHAFIVGKAEVLRDPDTGEVLDKSVETIAKIRVTRVKEKLSICEVTEGTGVKKGMTIMYQP